MGSEISVFQACLVLQGRRCLVVGGGRIATRKVEGLVSAGAEVTVIAPEIAPEIVALPVRVERRAYRRGDAAQYRLVLTATGRPEVDRLVFEDGELCGVFVNAADDRASCSFLVPAVLRRGPVSVAVSTGGTSPALAVWLRDRIAELVGPETETIAYLLERARAEVKSAGISTESLDWSSLIEGDKESAAGTLGVAALVSAGRFPDAEQLVAQWLAGVLGRAAAVPA
jgi:precorrin-2 dehydrogenase / sirohydrochlorin ferrochelatase